MLSLITVSYHSHARIERLWASLQAFAPATEWELIVVDNGSDPAETAKLQQLFSGQPAAHLVPLTANLGFGAGNEEGVKFAHGEIIAFINPDIELQTDTFPPLLAALQPENVGIVTPRLQAPDGTSLPNTWRFPQFSELIWRRLVGTGHESHGEITDGDKPVPVEWAQGSFLVMKKSFFTETLQGFDDRFFLFFEDTDLCRRSWESGYRVLQVPTALATHSPHRLSGGHFLTAMFKRTFWIHALSAVKYFRKWHGKPKPTIF